MNYAQEQRLRLIDFLLEHYGSVGRAQVEDFFGIGPATATRDFALYIKTYPGNAVMNPTSKRWVKTDTFKSAFGPDPAEIEMDVTKKRDPGVPAEQQGVFRKFDVRRTDGSDQPGEKHHGCRYFVLDLDHDPHAAAAMAAYAEDCKATHPVLSAELSEEYPPHAVDASTVDRAWARFCGAFGDGPDAPYPGMIAAFEIHYGQSFRDIAWRTEAACWAAAWHKATEQAAKTQPQPQNDG